MDAPKTQFLLGILMESPLYTTLSVEERRSLLSRLEMSYPSLFAEGNIDTVGGETLRHESTWTGIFSG